jgi:hypothetical protein
LVTPVNLTILSSYPKPKPNIFVPSSVLFLFLKIKLGVFDGGFGVKQFQTLIKKEFILN